MCNQSIHIDILRQIHSVTVHVILTSRDTLLCIASLQLYVKKHTDHKVFMHGSLLLHRIKLSKINAQSCANWYTKILANGG